MASEYIMSAREEFERRLQLGEFGRIQRARDALPRLNPYTRRLSYEDIASGMSCPRRRLPEKYWATRIIKGQRWYMRCSLSNSHGYVTRRLPASGMVTIGMTMGVVKDDRTDLEQLEEDMKDACRFKGWWTDSTGVKRRLNFVLPNQRSPYEREENSSAMEAE